jgi:hypothetical protein
MTNLEESEPSESPRAQKGWFVPWDSPHSAVGLPEIWIEETGEGFFLGSPPGEGIMLAFDTFCPMNLRTVSEGALSSLTYDEDRGFPPRAQKH